jgi:RNA 3'-terminal phosphate cyclase
MAKNTDLLEYEGANFLRQRVVLSILSGRAVRIKNIRTAHDEPGLRGKHTHF